MTRLRYALISTRFIISETYSITLFVACVLDWQESCHEFEQLVIVQCEALIQLIQERREYLLETLQMDKDNKLRILKVRQTL